VSEGQEGAITIVLGRRSRAELVRYALKHGLLEEDDD
jgi:hypothetical protein